MVGMSSSMSRARHLPGRWMSCRVSMIPTQKRCGNLIGNHDIGYHWFRGFRPPE